MADSWGVDLSGNPARSPLPIRRNNSSSQINVRRNGSGGGGGGTTSISQQSTPNAGYRATPGMGTQFSFNPRTTRTASGTTTLRPGYLPSGSLGGRANANASARAGASSGLGGAGNSFGANYNDLMAFYNNMFDRQFENTAKTMDLTHRFRVLGGETRGQIDDQMFKRLNAELETRKYLATDAVQQNRDADFARAVKGLRMMQGRQGYQ